MTVGRASVPALVALAGSRTELARAHLPGLYRRVAQAPPDSFAPWAETFGVVYGDVGVAPAALAELRRTHPWVPDDAGLLPLLFALHTWVALALGPDDEDEIFSWTSVPELDVQQEAPAEPADTARALYHDVVPRALRHALGEYFTPDWLAAHALARAGFTGEPGQTVLDPTCGSGAFLVQALRAKKARIPDPEALAEDVARTIVGVDVNPIAARMARANLRLAMAHGRLGARRHAGARGGRIWRADAVLDRPPIGRFDVVVGNPPWVSWPHLPAGYRERVLETWLSYGLFDRKGYEARTTHDDFSLAVTCVAADRFLADGGTMAFVLSQSAFQAKKGGDGFRRLRLGRGDDATPLEVVAVDDLVAVKPFAGAANRTAVAVMRKGRATTFPVAYTTWRKAARGAISEESTLEEALRSVVRAEGRAVPVDPTDARSPWLVVPEADLADVRRLLGPSPYRGRKGVEPLGAKGVYLLHPPVGKKGLLLIRNDLGRGRLAAIEAIGEVPGEIEPDLVFPAVSGRHLTRWGLRGVAWMLVPHEARPGPHNAIPEATMARRWPRTLAWLRTFEAPLRQTRARNGKFFDPKLDPFYALDNVGTYTFAPYKVAWKEQARGLEACVIGSWGGKLVLPDSKVLFCGLDDEREAHFLCALLNSAPVRRVIEASTIETQRGADVLGRVRLPRYDPADEIHAALADWSLRAHADVERGREPAPEAGLEALGKKAF